MGILDKLGQRFGHLVDDFTLTETQRAALEVGQKALAAGAFAQAETKFKEVLSDTSSLARAWYWLGVSQLRQGKLEAARASLERARTLRPDSVEILVTLAELWRQAGEHQAAFQAFKESLQLHPDEQLLSQIFAGLGEIYLSRGEADHAVRELRKANAALPAPDRALLGRLGLAHYQAGHEDEAAAALSRAATAIPAPRETLLLLIDVLLRRDQPAEARRAAQRLLQEDENDVQARLALARAYLAQRKPAEARQELLQALALAPEHVTLQRLLGEVYQQAQDPRSALTHVRQAITHAQKQQLTAKELTPLWRSALSLQLELELLVTHPAVASRTPTPTDEDAVDRAAPLDPAAHLGVRSASRSSGELSTCPQGRRAVKLPLCPVDMWVTRPPRPGHESRPPLELDPRITRQLGEDARQLLSLAPEDPLAVACLALAMSDEIASARELVARSLAQKDSYAGQLVRGVLALVHGPTDQAVRALREALRRRPHSRQALQLLGQAYAQQANPDASGAGAADLYPVLQRVRQLLASHPTLAHLAPEVTRIQEIVDRPLMVTVMGEFNSGKSTFVNALIGEKVAPMGVTPTTATINILKYGTQRSARVLWRDDREEIVTWRELPRFLSGLTREQARRILWVEILYPAEELLRVNVVDTPGLNSMIDEHEQTTRAYLAQADAVIWLFSALQAGKQTEEQALTLIKQHQRKTVGVINKIDQVRPDDQTQVLQHVQQSFAQLTETIMVLSARQALEAIIIDDQEALIRSNWTALRRFLEEQIFDQRRTIKQEACQHKLLELLTQAAPLIDAALKRSAADQQTVAQWFVAVQKHFSVSTGQQASADPLGGSAPSPPQPGDEDRDDRDHRSPRSDSTKAKPGALAAQQGLVERERSQLNRALQELYRRAAQEVLDFVRPRRWFLGENRSTQADRDFLRALLLESIGQMLQGSAARIAAHMEQAARLSTQALDRIEPGASGFAVEPLPFPVIEMLAELQRERLSLVQQQVYTRYLAFARGYLQGGRVDHFFSHVLPRIDLAVEPIYDALFDDRIDLEQELLLPLTAWYRETIALWLGHLQRLQQEIYLSQQEIEQRLQAPLQQMMIMLAPKAMKP